MSPLEIHCLLEYHTMPWGSTDIHHRHSMAVQSLERGGLIEVDEGAAPDQPAHILTDRGRAHIENLLTLPWPVVQWVIPDLDKQD